MLRKGLYTILNTLSTLFTINFKKKMEKKFHSVKHKLINLIE